MAALPQNNTSRVFVDYVARTDGIEHTFAVRYSGAADSDSALVAVTGLLTSIGQAHFLDGWRVLRCRAQGKDQNFSLPLTVPEPLGSFHGTAGPGNVWTDPLEFSFVGRSPTTGRKVRLPLYGVTGIVLTTGFRATPTDPDAAWIANPLEFLNARVDTFTTIDGSKATWYPYLDWQWNSYWESEIRKAK